MFIIEPSQIPTMLGTQQLIAEKLTIPAIPIGLSRERLLNLLEQSLASCASTILNARAGAGKTTLAVNFARRCGRPVAWYKVDAPDGELPVFFEYLTAAIRQQRPGFGSESLKDLFTNTGDESAAPLAETFAYELMEAGNEPLLVVIEDLHLVCDALWLVPFFKRLLPLLPPDIHILMTSRTMPPAPQWRMRSKQTLTVIDEEMLNFTRQEAIELFESYGLSPEQSCIAVDHTHGRAAALIGVVSTLKAAEPIGEVSNSCQPFSLALKQLARVSNE